MAANYATGAATSPTDLLDKLVTFLTGQGWTSDSVATDGTGKRAHLHKGSDYVNFRSHVAEAIWPNVQSTPVSTGIGLYMGTGYSGASAWSLQAGAPKANGTSDTVGATMRMLSGAITAYHFFDDGADNIVVVVERSGGLFTHLGFGRTFNKAGTWTGGLYFFSTHAAQFGGTTTQIMGDDNTSGGPPFGICQNYNTGTSTQLGCAAFVRVDVDAFTGKWVGFSALGTTGAEGYTGKRGHSGIDYNTGAVLVPPEIAGFARLLTHIVSNFNAQAPMLPIRAYAERDAGGWSLIGDLPNVFICGAVENGFSAASIQTVNGKDFMLFPHIAVRKFA
jgi:hypothetical protein